MFVEKEKHICLNCKFYCKGSHYDCRENIDELVKDKDRPNFCEYFSLDESALLKNQEKKQKSTSSAEDLFNSLFKD